MDPGVFGDVRVLAVVLARVGQLPLGATEATAEAGGAVLVLGSGAAEAAEELAGLGATTVWFTDTGPGLRAGMLADQVGRLLAGTDLVVLPASADGRDLAPRLAATLRRPLLAGAVAVRFDGAARRTVAELSRLESRLALLTEVAGPAVATLLPGARTGPGQTQLTARPVPIEVTLPAPSTAVAGTPEVEVLEILEPDPATMDLGEAVRVLGGGAGLVASRGGAGGPGGGDGAATASFELLTAVAARLGASAGATRVVTDAGWMGYDRQIGTTGVAIDPDLYIAFGVSGASQHTGGLGSPRHVVSVNTDPSCPMTAMADLGLITDASALLLELARRLDVPVPAHLDPAGHAGAPPQPAPPNSAPPTTAPSNAAPPNAAPVVPAPAQEARHG